MELKDEIKSSFRNDRQKALVNLIYTNFYIKSKFQALFKKYDVTQQQYNILRILRGQHPQVVNFGLIKERMLDKSSDVTRLVERLRLKKLVQRKVSKSDRRKMDVVITQKGLELLNNMDSCEKGMDDVLSKLSDQDVNNINKLLDKLRG